MAIVIAVTTGLFLKQARFGRQVYAVGSNPEAAAILGIRSRLVVFVVFAACGLLAGVAGVLWGGRFRTITAGGPPPPRSCVSASRRCARAEGCLCVAAACFGIRCT